MIQRINLSLYYVFLLTFKYCTKELLTMDELLKHINYILNARVQFDIKLTDGYALPCMVSMHLN